MVGIFLLSLTAVSEALHDLSHSTPLLPDGHVDSVQLLPLIVSVVEPLLVDDGVNGDGSLAAPGREKGGH